MAFLSFTSAPESLTPPKEPPDAAGNFLLPPAAESADVDFGGASVATVLPPKVTGFVTSNFGVAFAACESVFASGSLTPPKEPPEACPKTLAPFGGADAVCFC